jgi:hypothetical protein
MAKRNGWIRVGVIGLAAVSSLVGACGANEAAAPAGTYQNNVFQRTRRLEAAIAGSPSTPSVSWPSTGRQLVVAGFFGRHIDVRQNLITNAGDLVWIWHTGLASGREGNVNWADGVPARWGEPQVGEAPGPLGPGTYYWAVWTLDDRGEPSESTIEFAHSVP